MIHLLRIIFMIKEGKPHESIASLDTPSSYGTMYSI